MEVIKKKLEIYLRRYSLDHQMILQRYLKEMTPRSIKTDWPPSLWHRLLYRLTHQRVKTYVTGFLILMLFCLLELSLIRRGFTLKRQWMSVHRAVQRVAVSLFSGRSDHTEKQPVAFPAQPDTTQHDPEGAG
jgi:hypothetical protein